MWKQSSSHLMDWGCNTIPHVKAIAWYLDKHQLIRYHSIHFQSKYFISSAYLKWKMFVLLESTYCTNRWKQTRARIMCCLQDTGTFKIYLKSSFPLKASNLKEEENNVLFARWYWQEVGRAPPHISLSQFLSNNLRILIFSKKIWHKLWQFLLYNYQLSNYNYICRRFSPTTCVFSHSQIRIVTII